MKYLDKYPNCVGCPVKKWCGTMISCIRLCKSYQENKTEMNYEERYKQAIEAAKRELHCCGSLDCDAARQIFRFFPELRESKDERIRKEILNHFNRILCGEDVEFPPQDSIDKWIAWLEKQGEKSVDEFEPKFKAGDWITNGSLLVGQVTSFDGEYYHYMCEGIEQPLHISNAYNWHLWTIQDAKDGDVLANKDGAIFINAGSGNGVGTLDCYCYLSVQNKFCVEDHKTGSWFYKDDIKPATKEQRDILFQKMKEAGYKWDAENKKLNKIEQESTWNEKIKGLNELETYILSLVPDRSLDAIKVDAKNIRYIINKEQKPAEWSEKDSKILNEIIEELTPYGECPDYPSPEEQEYYYTRTSMIDWLKSLKDRVQPQPKQEWSEEDEKIMKRIDSLLYSLCQIHGSEYEQLHNWLKSLNPQNRWKPSEEQMSMLLALLNDSNNITSESVHIVLKSLYQDLLKL